MQIDDTALAGRCVLVTRPESQASGLCQLIEQSGGRAIRLPTIAIRARQLSAEQHQAALKQIADSELIIFISQTAVQQFERQFAGQLAALQGKQLVAMGDSTRTHLAKHHIGDVLSVESGMGSEALLDLPPLAAHAVVAKRILIVKGDGGRALLYDSLHERGASLHTLELYRRDKPQTSRLQLTTIWNHSRPDSMIFTSGEGMANFLEMTAAVDLAGLYRTPALVFGGRIAALAQAAGFAHVRQVDMASDDALLRALYQLHRVENSKVEN